MDFDSDDALVREAVLVDERLREALHDHDVETAERLYGPEFTLNSPAGRVQTRDETIEFVRAGGMRQVDATRSIEAAYRSGDDVVVIMGYESFVWEAPGHEFDGRSTARRFTNVWRLAHGSWQHVARQATTVTSRAVEEHPTPSS